MSDVGVFRTTIEIQSLDLRGPRQVLPETLVDTGSEFTWVPRRVLEELGIRASAHRHSKSRMGVASSATSATHWCAPAERKRRI